ncbi:hypothetical protein [Nocardia sp. NPDC004260]
MRKALAGLLIRTAHRIYRPTVEPVELVTVQLPNGGILLRDTKTGVIKGGVGGGTSSFGNYASAHNGVRYAETGVALTTAEKLARRWVPLLDRLSGYDGPARQ